MNKISHQKIIRYFQVLLQSYGSLIFSTHWAPSLLIFMTTFIHPKLGLAGLLGNAMANAAAMWIHAHPDRIRSGIFGVNGFLVGLALGISFGITPLTILGIIIAALLATVVTQTLATILYQNELSAMSLPFMLVVLPLLIAIPKAYSVLFFAPPPIFSSLDRWLFERIPLELFQFIQMFGNILFQENLLSGVLVLLAILSYSRIAVLYALWSGLLGLLLHTFVLGGNGQFYGLNYVLTGLALGGFFLVSNRHSFFYTSLAVITSGLLERALGVVFQNIATHPIPTLVLPFNLTALLFLYPVKKIPLHLKELRLIAVPLNLLKSPETNLRWAQRWLQRRFVQKTMFTLPVMGKWSILQGHDGEWTHKGNGRYAWDFVVRDENGDQAAGFGIELSDFYAFGLPVFAPAPGIVSAVENSVPDNPPRIAATEANWGNFVIIDHGNGEYSELSHLKQGSIPLVAGQRVARGQLIGYCGNSGRSPVPHLHFQVQNGPWLASESLPVKFAEAKINGCHCLNVIPKKDETVEPLLVEASASWNLLGKEGESWTYQVRTGVLRFREALEFTTDPFGWPIIASQNQFVWYLLDKPNFIEIVPDFKTFPSLLSPSGWLKAVGESLIIPKNLAHGLEWQGGKILKNEKQIWEIESGNVLISLDAEKQLILKVRLKNEPRFEMKFIRANQESR
jgi:urea transporter/murein DD-endopeptidase MepM/ murein hydrolase activator NlpD